MDFRYEAKASDGRTMSGTRNAPNESAVVAWIRENGWIPINVTQARGEISLKASGDSVADKAAQKDSFWELSPRIKLRDKAIFFRQLATMIDAGIPVSAALAVLSDQTQNKRFSRIIAKTYRGVSSGAALGHTLAEYPKCFDALTVPLVKAGEESGTLGNSLSKLAGFLEDQDSLRKKIISAMTYPIVVIAIALIVLGVMVAVVIPQFEKAFSNLSIELPALTRMTFSLGRWMQSRWYYIPLAFIALIAAARYLRKVKALKLPIDSMMIKIPIFGDIIFKAALVRTFRTMGTLLRSGVPVLSALEMTADVAANEKIKQSFLEMRDGASMGKALNSIVREKKLFPPMIGHMIAVGEETGRTDEMLEKVADWYDTELSEKIKRLSSILEPVMVVFVGIIVFFMVLAIFLPIISAIQAFM
ncbi:MAG: type II secretion system F family protein [Synergistaceae bacterium]|nr:type II secretion system F family protein [Synergistaceae bacterium]